MLPAGSGSDVLASCLSGRVYLLISSIPSPPLKIRRYSARTNCSTKLRALSRGGCARASSTTSRARSRSGRRVTRWSRSAGQSKQHARADGVALRPLGAGSSCSRAAAHSRAARPERRTNSLRRSFTCGAGEGWVCLWCILSRIRNKIRPLRVCGGTCGGTLKAKAYGYALC
jgi:hypothetical protein